MTVCVGLSKCCTQSNMNFYFDFHSPILLQVFTKFCWPLNVLIMTVNLQKQMKSFCKLKWTRNLKKRKKKFLGKSLEQKCFVKSFPVFWYFNKDHMIWGLFLVMILNSGCHFCESLPYKGQTFVLLAMIC